MPEFLVFQQFETIEEAAAIAEILQDAGIETAIEKPGSILDSNFIGAKYQPAINLKIEGRYFTEARQVLLEKYKVDLNEVGDDHMLASFSNEELNDVLAKPDEWGFYNCNVALALLEKRGVDLSAQQREKLEEDRIAELAVPRSMSFFWVVMGYILPAVNLIVYLNGNEYSFSNAVYLLPAFLGILIGIVLIYAKRTLPNGTRVWMNSPEIRKHGPIILWVNILVWAFNITITIIDVTT
jgi:hypothetical protein